MLAVVDDADLAELLPLMRDYCDFYEVSPSDADLLAMSRALIADPEHEGLQLIARAGAGGDDGEVHEDPQAEGVAVIHVGLVQAFDEAQTGAISAEEEQGHPGREPQDEVRGGPAPEATGDEFSIHGRTPFRGVVRERFRAPSSSWTGSRFWDRWRAIPASGSCPEGGRCERFRWPGR